MGSTERKKSHTALERNDGEKMCLLMSDAVSTNNSEDNTSHLPVLALSLLSVAFIFLQNSTFPAVANGERIHTEEVKESSSGREKPRESQLSLLISCIINGT